jgi:hypothetical protein
MVTHITHYENTHQITMLYFPPVMPTVKKSTKIINVCVTKQQTSAIRRKMWMNMMRGYKVLGMCSFQDSYMYIYSFTGVDHLRSTPLDQLCIYPNDAATLQKEQLSVSSYFF